ncbi:SLC13 family permease [Aestuariivirga sp.]|uniref:SLC13 family permease n=1 Tax=Aestuariivirga sp. TaxID=2650926 RepID=UPI0039E26058
MTSLPVIVFILVYLGMAVGTVPGLRLDRTGVALIGLIVLLASGDLSMAKAGAAVDMPTITLLFALMILSAQFEGSGFYGLVAAKITRAVHAPKLLLAVIIAVTGILSAILTNDVVVFALTPLICTALLAQGLDARPYLVALAGAANAGSAATLIGNPQNILLGQAGGLSFGRYLLLALPPTLVALVFVFLAVIWTWRGSLAATPHEGKTEQPQVDRFQLAKGIVAIAVLIGLFLTPFPRELSALAVAGVLLLSKRMSSRDMIGAVDWHLLLLFICLFGVTAAFAETGLAQEALVSLKAHGLSLDRLSVLSPLMLAASNTIGNVPTIILILKIVPDLSQGVLAAMALLSTFAGNLLLTGSLCNIIVAERAKASGGDLSFMDFMRSGIVMTLFAMAAATAWLWLTGSVQF